MRNLNQCESETCAGEHTRGAHPFTAALNEHTLKTDSTEVFHVFALNIMVMCKMAICVNENEWFHHRCDVIYMKHVSHEPSLLWP